MSKRIRLEEVADQFVKKLQDRFPDADVQALVESIGGFDVWVRVGLPADRPDSMWEEVHDLAAKLSVDFSEKTDVWVVTTCYDKHPQDEGTPVGAE
jgi:hypothetical protein